MSRFLGLIAISKTSGFVILVTFVVTSAIFSFTALLVKDILFLVMVQNSDYGSDCSVFMDRIADNMQIILWEL